MHPQSKETVFFQEKGKEKEKKYNYSRSPCADKKDKTCRRSHVRKNIHHQTNCQLSKDGHDKKNKQ